MGKSTDGPWTVPGGVIVTVKNKRSSFVPITDGNGSTMALVPMGSGRSESRAALIVQSVNERDALLARVAELDGVVRNLLDSDEPWDQRATAARAALR